MTNEPADLVHRLARTLRAEVVETHISWVLLAPGLAYKLKKPAHAYARTALAWSAGGQPHLAITHGLPGSGKSFVSQRLLQQQGAIRLRSDVERKRMFGLQPLDDSRARGVDLYTAAVTFLAPPPQAASAGSIG